MHLVLIPHLLTATGGKMLNKIFLDYCNTSRHRSMEYFTTRAIVQWGVLHKAHVAK
jgi:hypothetical protein